MIATTFTIVLVLLFELSGSSTTSTYEGRCALLVFCSAIVCCSSFASVAFWREYRNEQSRTVPEIRATTFVKSPSLTSTLSAPLKGDLHPDEQCPLCKRKLCDPAEDLLPLYLPCGHLWCEACIEDYIVIQRRVEDCPLCRQKIRPKLQKFRANIVHLQMAFAHTVFANAIMLSSFTLMMLFTPSYPLDEHPAISVDRVSGFLPISYVAGRNICVLFFCWTGTQVASENKPERCGIVATLQRIVVPLLYLSRGYQTLRIAAEHAVQPLQLVSPKDIQNPGAIATALIWIGYVTLVLFSGDDRKFVWNLPMNCQFWCRMALDILL